MISLSVNSSILNRTFGGLALTIAYGLPIREHDDPHLALAEEAVQTVSETVVPGAFLVDFMPFLKYVPEWMPGAGFQKTAKKYFEIQERFRSEPFGAALKNIASFDPTEFQSRFDLLMHRQTELQDPRSRQSHLKTKRARCAKTWK